MLDEIDKLSASFHGDPGSALLEVLDPEQNSTFRDNYIAQPFDLSAGCCSSPRPTCSTPLPDRCAIAWRSSSSAATPRRRSSRSPSATCVQRQLKANGLDRSQVQITDAALRRIISDYTREAGCRSLERQIGALVRNAAMHDRRRARPRVAFDAPDLAAVLGAPRFENEVAQRTSVPGVATGLAWTPVGGDILFVESARLPGNGKLILTGQLGEVMKESAQAASVW